MAALTHIPQAKNACLRFKKGGHCSHWTQTANTPASAGVKSKRRPAQHIAVKSTAIAYVLWLLGGFGVLGLHRFYLGRWVSGLVWLFTGGLLGIGAIIDLFLIPGMVRIENLSQQLLVEASRGSRAGPPAAVAHV
jgi:hypothetical protein